MTNSSSIKLLPLFFSSFALCSFLLSEDQNVTFSDEELMEMLFEEPERVELKEEPESKWISSYSGETGAGYSDNPLYGPFIREDAPYMESSIEAFFLKDGGSGAFSYLYLFGEGKVFEGLPEYKTSSILLGQFDHSINPFQSVVTYGIRFRHTFYDQAFDFSELGLPYRIKVQSNKTECIPYVVYKFSDEIKATLELIGGKEDYRKISDDNQFKAIALALKGSSNFGSWKLATKFYEKNYQDRLKRKSDGSLFSFDSVETKRIQLSIGMDHTFEIPTFRNSSANLRLDRLSDQAGAYYDHKKISLALEQEIEFHPYEIALSTDLSKTQYDQRTINTGERFERDGLQFGVSIKREIPEISEKLDLYLRWSREEDFSNDRDYEYFSNFWSFGISWEI